jgi:hypothetical protein
MMPVAEPMTTSAARHLLRGILASGEVVFSGHALAEMRADGITHAEVIHVLRGGTVEPGELERASWRYRVRARDVYAVVTFRSAAMAIVVTAWRRTR